MSVRRAALVAAGAVLFAVSLAAAKDTPRPPGLPDPPIAPVSTASTLSAEDAEIVRNLELVETLNLIEEFWFFVRLYAPPDPGDAVPPRGAPPADQERAPAPPTRPADPGGAPSPSSRDTDVPRDANVPPPARPFRPGRVGRDEEDPDGEGGHVETATARDLGRAAAAASSEDRDAQLMLEVAGEGPGARSAFRELFRHHYSGVVGFCVRIVRDRATAEELAQETFLRLYRARDRYTPSARFRTYLLTIAQRLCLNELRRPRRRAGEEIPLDGAPAGRDRDGGPVIQVADDRTVAADRRAESRQQLDRVGAILDGMPARQRMATVLNRIEGLSYEEVAAAMGCSTRAVKSLLNRSRRLIAEKMSEPERTR